MKNSPISLPTGEVRSILEQTARVLVFAVLYFVVGKLCLSLGQGVITAVWPPAGMALVILLMLGYRMWPSIFLGSLVLNWSASGRLDIAFWLSVGNTLEALFAAYLLKTVFNFKNRFDKPRDAFAFALSAGAGSAIAGIVSPSTLLAAKMISMDQWRSTAATWWLSDVMGILVFGTFLLVVFDSSAFQILRKRGLEAGLILALVFAASVYIMTGKFSSPTTYLLFPFVMLAAVRLTQIGVVSSSILVTIVAIWSTLYNMGPFSRMPTGEYRLIDLEFYVSILTATSLILAMAIQERSRAEEKLTHRTNELDRLQKELKDANMRVTNILSGILDESSPRRGNGSHNGGHDRTTVQQREEG